MSQVFTARRHLVEFVKCNGDRLPMRQISISCSLKLAHDLSCSLASAQVAPSHLSHTHSMCWSKTCTTRTTPLYYFTKSWNLSHEVACIDGLLLKNPEKIFRVPLPKTQRLFAKHFWPHFLHFVYLPMFGSKTWTKFWNSRLCGYGTDTSIHWWLFRRCSRKGWNEGMLVGQRHLAVESCMAVYNLYEECWHCWLWMALTQLCAVMRSGEPGLLGVFDYEYEEYDCCAHHEPNPTTFSSKLLWLPTYNMYTLEVQDHQNNSPQFWMIKFPTKKIVLRENLSF